MLLGANLAAANMICTLGGAVRFVDNPQWIQRSRAYLLRTVSVIPLLPSFYVPGWQIEAIGVPSSRFLLFMLQYN